MHARPRRSNLSSRGRFPRKSGAQTLLTTRKNLRGLEQDLLALIASEFGFKCLGLCESSAHMFGTCGGNCSDQFVGIGVVDVNTFFGIDAGARDSHRLVPNYLRPYSLNTPAHTRRLPDAVEVKWKFCGTRSNEEQSC